MTVKVNSMNIKSVIPSLYLNEIARELCWSFPLTTKVNKEQGNMISLRHFIISTSTIGPDQKTKILNGNA